MVNDGVRQAERHGLLSLEPGILAADPVNLVQRFPGVLGEDAAENFSGRHQLGTFLLNFQRAAGHSPGHQRVVNQDFAMFQDSRRSPAAKRTAAMLAAVPTHTVRILQGTACMTS